MDAKWLKIGENLKREHPVLYRVLRYFLLKFLIVLQSGKQK